jgi:hypothetical protein
VIPRDPMTITFDQRNADYGSNDLAEDSEEARYEATPSSILPLSEKHGLSF